VVHEGSATLYKANEFVIGLDANHKNMCKFSGRNSLYLVVLGRLSTEIAAIRTPVADSAPVVDEERMLRVEDLFGSVPNLSTPRRLECLTQLQRQVFYIGHRRYTVKPKLTYGRESPIWYQRMVSR
jgi:hypothetical protein